MIEWPTKLSGGRLRLEGLSERHVEGLWKYADPAILNLNNMWAGSKDLGEFRDLILGLIASPLYVPYAMILVETGAAVGSSSYLDVRLEHKAVEIGGTWIGASFQGTFVNPEAKLLMLAYAFEALGCNRVQLKTDERNIQSQKAMEKLGCVREGTLRRHTICQDGFIRNTVMYSITSEEWPRVKESVTARLEML